MPFGSQSPRAWVELIQYLDWTSRRNALQKEMANQAQPRVDGNT